jgi:hypothetical protein
MNIFNNGIIIGLCLAITDIISMSITKQITVGYLQNKWMVFAFILYGCQILIFKHGLELTSMTILNLTWNLFSSIVITLIGVYYFQEKINDLESYGILFALFSLFLFSVNEYKNKNIII